MIGDSDLGEPRVKKVKCITSAGDDLHNIAVKNDPDKEPSMNSDEVATEAESMNLRCSELANKTNGKISTLNGNQIVSSVSDKDIISSSNDKEIISSVTDKQITSSGDHEVTHFADADDDDADSFPLPPDDDVTEMLEEVQYTGSFPTITDRYLTAYYKLDVQAPADDVRILLHSNRICMLSLAPSHAILRPGSQITKVDFRVSEKLDRALNKVSGKGKHGAQPLQGNSNICTVTGSDGKSYTIKCCMIGKLVEVNEALIEKPQLLHESPHRGGYLAIILPNLKLLDKMREALLTQTQYEEALRDREERSNNVIANDAGTLSEMR